MKLNQVLNQQSKAEEEEEDETVLSIFLGALVTL